MAQWKRGFSGNPNGRPRKGKAESDKLRDAVARVAKRQGIDFYDTFAEMAFVEPSVMIALMRKILPDLKAVESTVDLKENFGVIMLPQKLPVGAPCEQS